MEGGQLVWAVSLGEDLDFKILVTNDDSISLDKPPLYRRHPAEPLVVEMSFIDEQTGELGGDRFTGKLIA